MFDLAPRFPQHCVVDTTPVGPTTYIVSDLKCKSTGESGFPFNCTNDRFDKFRPSPGPAPTTYFPKYRKKRILGGKSLQYTTPRICIVPKKKTTTYSFDQQNSSRFTESNFWGKSTRIQSSSTTSKAFKFRSSTTKYEDEPATEELVRKIYTTRSLPDYLKFPGETSKASLKYRGSRWSQYKTERTHLAVSNGIPGPATYDIRPNITKKPPKEFLRKTTDYRGKSVSMTGNLPETRAIMNSVHDDITKTTHFFDGTCDYLYKAVSHNKSPLGVWGKTERFIVKVTDDIPAPCQYYPKPVKCLRRVVKLLPFLSCSPRFKTAKITELSPASYNQQYGTIFERSCSQLAKIWGSLRAPFNSTTPRISIPEKEPFFEEEESENKDYLCVKQVILPQNSNISSKSVEAHQKTAKLDLQEDYMYQIIGTSLRFVDEGVEENRAPLVDMRDVYAKYKGKRSHRKPVKNEGFLSVSQNRTSWLVRKTTAHDVGWPSIDNVKVTGGALKMNLPQNQEKPEPKQDQSVFYDIHPRYSSSIYKPTHNYRLKKQEIEKTYEDPDNVKTILKCFMPKEILNA